MKCKHQWQVAGNYDDNRMIAIMGIKTTGICNKK